MADKSKIHPTNIKPKSNEVTTLPFGSLPEEHHDYEDNQNVSQLINKSDDVPLIVEDPNTTPITKPKDAGSESSTKFGGQAFDNGGTEMTSLKARAAEASRGQSALDMTAMESMARIPSMASQSEIDLDDMLFSAGKKMIPAIHNQNRLEDFQYNSPKEFMSKVKYQIELDSLYKVIASCQYNDAAQFCPVLVQIKDPQIVERNDGKPFLLQVWDLKGILIYERSLHQPCSNWGISDENFVFQEDSSKPEVFLVKLFQDKTPLIYQFYLPQQTTAKIISTQFNAKSGKFEVPKEDHLKSSADHDKYLVDKRQAKSQFFDGSYQDINADFSTEIIVRAPDKMIDFLQGHLLLAFSDKINYVKVDEYVKSDVSEIQKTQEGVEIDGNLIKIILKDSQIKSLDTSANFKVISLLEITNDMSAICLENLNSRQLQFYRLSLTDGQLRLVNMSAQRGPSDMIGVYSPLLKFRSVSKGDPKTHKQYQLSIALRQNGAFEVYSDFKLSNIYQDPALQCVDIETDYNLFYLKLAKVKKQEHVSDVADLDFEIRKADHFWRNRLSFTTSSKVSKEKWTRVIHKRISNFFNLFTQVINFDTFMILSHRNAITIFEMKQQYKMNSETQELEIKKSPAVTYFFDENIREMILKAIPKEERIKLLEVKQRKAQAQIEAKTALSMFEKYEIVLVMGLTTIVNLQLKKNGQIKTQDKTMSPGKIMSIKNDSKYSMGILMLIAAGLDEPTRVYKDGHSLFKFAYSNESFSQLPLTLQVYKMGAFYELADSKKLNTLCIDSYFGVMKVDRTFYEQDSNNFEVDQKAENRAEDILFNNKHVNVKKIRVLFLASKSSVSQCIIPMIKEKDEQGITKNIYIEESLKRECSLNSRENEVCEDSINAFSITSEEFGDNKDSVVVTSYNAIKIFDKQLKLKMQITGLNMVACMPVHQSYLYMINNTITRRWTLTNYSQNEEEESRPDIWKLTGSGFYILDLQRLLKGKVEKYKLLANIGGFANKINNSDFTDRFSIIQQFDSLTVIPFPHLNLINFISMERKSQYLIWREKNGFFSALNKRGQLNIWTLFDGKFHYFEDFSQQVGFNLKDYQVYRSDSDDITYTRDSYQLEKESFTLIRGKAPFEPGHRDNDQTLNRPLSDMIEVQEELHDSQAFKTLDDTDVQVQESSTVTVPYHFKVLSLQSYEDNHRENEVKVKFHFLFDKVTSLGDDTKVFQWDDSEVPVQRLYLSHDTKLLMEVINNFIATVYYRVNVDGGADCDGQLVKWKRLYRIKSYPRSLMTQTSVPFLFSPNFKYQLDFNYRQKQFIIRQTDTQAVHLKIPKDLLNTDWNKITGEAAIKIITSRFKWIDDSTFRIINEANLDSIFCIREAYQNVQDGQGQVQKQVTHYIELMSSVKVDNLFVNMNTRNEPHVLLHKAQLDSRDTLDRLIRLNQRYKVSLQHAINLKSKGFDLLTMINSIDFQQEWTDMQAHFDVQLTYTWLDWYISQLVIKDDSFDLGNIDEEQQIQLCFNIMPKGRGVLHFLAQGLEHEDADNSQDQRHAYTATKELFEVASQKTQVWIVGEDEDEGSSFEIPILQDIYGFTPIDFCMGMTELKFKNSDVFRCESEDKTSQHKSQNLAMAIVIFQKLSDYGYMHSSYQITEGLFEAIRVSLPFIDEYLESRFKNADHVFQLKTQKTINPKMIRHSDTIGDYAAISAPNWVPMSMIADEIFEKEGALVPMNLSYLDVPYAYTHNHVGFEFINVLEECPNEEIFTLSSIQILIDNQFQYWQKINYLAVGLPIALQLMVFWYWSNVIQPNLSQDSKDFKDQESFAIFLLVVISIYLLFIEVTALYVKKLDFFKSLTKIVNLITPSIILYVSFDRDFESIRFWEVMTWTALLIWLRFLLFMKSIPVFSYLIRIITASFYDMATFIIVLIVGVIAFADAFLSIEQILILDGRLEPKVIKEDPSVYEKYFQNYIFAWQKSYATALGEFDGNVEFYRERDWFVWMLCTIFNLVILFNLLIAIISETFARIDETSVQTGYREKVNQIRNLQDSILGMAHDTISATRMIFVARESSTKEIHNDEVTDGIEELNSKLDDVKNEIIESTTEQLQELYVSFKDKLEQNTEEALAANRNMMRRGAKKGKGNKKKRVDYQNEENDLF